jgi:hypothetical protein
LGWGFPIWWVSLYFQRSQKQEFATHRGSTHNSLPPWTELASSREVPTIAKQVDRDTALGHGLVPTTSPLPPSESWFAAATSSTPLVVPSLVKNIQDLWRNLHLMGSYHITPVTTLWTDVLLQGFASAQTILQTYNAVWFLKAKLPVETGSMLILLKSRARGIVKTSKELFSSRLIHIVPTGCMICAWSYKPSWLPPAHGSFIKQNDPETHPSSDTNKQEFLNICHKELEQKFRHTYLNQRGLIEHTVLNPSVEIWFCISPHKPRAGWFSTRENMNQRKLHSI